MDEHGHRRVSREVSTRESGRQTARRIILTLTLLVVVLLLLRFFFRLASANEANVFVDLIYMITNPLVWPFASIFPDLTFEGVVGTGVLEADTLLATVVWAIVGGLIARLIAPARPEMVSRSDVAEHEHRDHDIRP